MSTSVRTSDGPTVPTGGGHTGGDYTHPPCRSGAPHPGTKGERCAWRRGRGPRGVVYAAARPADMTSAADHRRGDLRSPRPTGARTMTHRYRLALLGLILGTA